MADRKQDMWRVVIGVEDEKGKEIRGLRMEGVVSLTRPMTALDAADYALRVAVRQGPVPARILVEVCGRSDIGSNSHTLCTAVAEYDDARKEFMRYTPWIDGEKYQRIAEPEGTSIIAFAQV